MQTAQERRSHWKKFGDALTERPTDAITGQATEDIPFERVRLAKQTQEDKNKNDFQAAMAGTDKAAIVGSLRDMLYKKRMQRQLLAAKGLIEQPELPPGEVRQAMCVCVGLLGTRGVCCVPGVRAATEIRLPATDPPI
jgi:hypothetical protein